MFSDALVFGSAHFGQGSGDIFLSSVGCTGSETSLLDCNHGTSLPYYCGHDDDAGVRCHGELIPCFYNVCSLGSVLISKVVKMLD